MERKKMGRPPLHGEVRKRALRANFSKTEHEKIKAFQRKYEQQNGEKIALADMLVRFMEENK